MKLASCTHTGAPWLGAFGGGTVFLSFFLGGVVLSSFFPFFVRGGYSCLVLGCCFLLLLLLLLFFFFLFWGGGGGRAGRAFWGGKVYQPISGGGLISAFWLMLPRKEPAISTGLGEVFRVVFFAV